MYFQRYKVKIKQNVLDRQYFIDVIGTLMSGDVKQRTI